MPELPEVERVRRELERAIVGRTVERVRVGRRDYVVGPEDPPGGFSRSRTEAPTTRVPGAQLLVGGVIGEVRRHGKALAILTTDARAVALHLGMTGSLGVADPPNRALDHVHVRWRLDRGELFMRDPRRFGGVWAGLDADRLAQRWARLGPDAMDLRSNALARAARGSKRPVKAVLLDQARLAGLGNIYADESLFRAGVLPTRPAGALTGQEIKRLSSAIRQILRAALRAGGSTLRDYRGSNGVAGAAQRSHRVYGRQALPCLRCGTTLIGGVVAQRTTVHCPTCQV